MDRATRPEPHPALTQLERFIGAWDLTMEVGGQRIGGVTATFEWVAGGAFVVERAAWVAPVEMPPGAPLPTTRLIGYDDTAEQFTMLYADGRAVARVYQMSLAGEHWEVWRDAPGEVWRDAPGEVWRDAPGEVWRDAPGFRQRQGQHSCPAVGVSAAARCPSCRASVSIIERCGR